MPPRGPEVRGRVALMTGQQLARPEKAADYTQRFAVLQQRTGSAGECTVLIISIHIPPASGVARQHEVELHTRVDEGSEILQRGYESRI